MTTVMFVLNLIASLAAGILIVIVQHLVTKRKGIKLALPLTPLIELGMAFVIMFFLSSHFFSAPLSTSTAMALITSLAVALANIISISKRMNKLLELSEILGAVDWSKSTTPGSTIANYLSLVSKNFKFMGMGFHKFVKYNNNEINLEKIVANCDRIAPRETIQILIMNPFCKQVAEYELKRGIQDEMTTTQKLLDSLLAIERLREKGYNIKARFYPNSMKAIANFRLFFLDSNRVFVSFYKYRDEGYNVPQLQLLESEQAKDITLYRPFSELYRYLWENGEDADYYKIYYPISTEAIQRGRIFDILKNYISECVKRFFPTTKIDTLSICLAALAGRDSVAAIVNTLKSKKFSVIIPVIINVPTEYGDQAVRRETVKKLRQYSEKNFEEFKSVVTATIVIDDKGLWGRINSGSKLLEIQQRYGAYSPCVGCHLYIHALRCHVAKELGIKSVISGDRESHGDIIKLNQLPVVLDTFQEFANNEYDVKLEFPLRNITDNGEIQKILRSARPPIYNLDDMSCHFGKSGSIDSNDIVDVKRWVKYLEEEAIPGFINEMR